MRKRVKKRNSQAWKNLLKPHGFNPKKSSDNIELHCLAGLTNKEGIFLGDKILPYTRLWFRNLCFNKQGYPQSFPILKIG